MSPRCLAPSSPPHRPLTPLTSLPLTARSPPLHRCLTAPSPLPHLSLTASILCIMSSRTGYFVRAFALTCAWMPHCHMRARGPAIVQVRACFLGYARPVQWWWGKEIPPCGALALSDGLVLCGRIEWCYEASWHHMVDQLCLWTKAVHPQRLQNADHELDLMKSNKKLEVYVPDHPLCSFITAASDLIYIFVWSLSKPNLNSSLILPKHVSVVAR